MPNSALISTRVTWNNEVTSFIWVSSGLSGRSFWITDIQLFFSISFFQKQDFSSAFKYPKYRFFFFKWPRIFLQIVFVVSGFCLHKTILIIPFGHRSILMTIFWENNLNDVIRKKKKKAFSESYNFLTNLGNKLLNYLKCCSLP